MTASQDQPQRLARDLAATEIHVAALEHDVWNERTLERRRSSRRWRIRLVVLTAGGCLSVVLFIAGHDIPSLTTSGAAPLVAEGLVWLRKL